MDGIAIEHLGLRPYVPVWEAMRAYTDARTDASADRLWVVEHPPVYTLGQAGRLEHLLRPGTIPVVHCDRGGQVTYHGPGQVVIYLLLDLRRRRVGVRELVTRMEASVIDLLAEEGVAAAARPQAPGVYVGEAKVAALGLRVRRGCTYHGLALNVAMDLEPFARINPCGYAGLPVTQLRDLGVAGTPAEIAQRLCGKLLGRLR